MKFKSGFVIGCAVGYILGAKAGRERYEQIKRGASAARRHPAVEQLGGQAGGLTDLMRSGIASGLEGGSKGLRATATPASAPASFATRTP